MDRQDEEPGDQRPDKVARDHHALAIHAVENHASQRPGEHGRNCARQHDTADRQPGSRSGYREAENGNVVEVVPDFADDLPDPGVPVIPVALEEGEEGGQPTDSSLTVISWIYSRL